MYTFFGTPPSGIGSKAMTHLRRGPRLGGTKVVTFGIRAERSAQRLLTHTPALPTSPTAPPPSILSSSPPGTASSSFTSSWKAAMVRLCSAGPFAREGGLDRGQHRHGPCRKHRQWYVVDHRRRLLEPPRSFAFSSPAACFIRARDAQHHKSYQKLTRYKSGNLPPKW